MRLQEQVEAMIEQTLPAEPSIAAPTSTPTLVALMALIDDYDNITLLNLETTQGVILMSWIVTAGKELIESMPDEVVYDYNWVKTLESIVIAWIAAYGELSGYHHLPSKAYLFFGELHAKMTEYRFKTNFPD